MKTVDNNMDNTLEASTVGSYIGGIYSLVVGVMTFQNMLALIGVALGIATFFVNRYYNGKKDQRATEKHALEMRKMELELSNMRNKIDIELINKGDE